MQELSEDFTKVTDVLLVKVAREIAMEHFDIEDVLKHHQIDNETWERIQRLPRFSELLASEIAAWNSATNTHERVKLKAAGLVEMWLEQANTDLYDKTNTLNSKIELAKLVTRLAGMGVQGFGAEGATGERFSVTINLGADQQLKIEKQLPPTTIDAEPVE